MIFDMKLLDCGYSGCRFTCSNNRDGNGGIRERLDRALGSDLWRMEFPKTQVIDESPIGSDHTPLVINLNWKEKKGRRRSRFENRWMLEAGCKSSIKSAWNDGVVQDIQGLEKKLSRCCRALFAWSRRAIPNS